MSRSVSRRGFFRMLRPAPATAASADPAPVPRGPFDLKAFYRQREVLGLSGAPPPPIPVRTDVRVATTRVGSPEVKKR